MRVDTINQALTDHFVPMVQHAIAAHQADPGASILDLAADALAHQTAVGLVGSAHQRVVGGKRSPLVNAGIASLEILTAAHVVRSTRERIDQRRRARTP